MNYIKKIWNYQKLLFSSIELNSSNFSNTSKRNNFGCLFFIPVFIFVILCSYIFENENMILLLFLAVYLMYMVINSKRKIYNIVPVSKKFAFYNLLLFPITFSLFAIIISYIVGFIFCLGLWLLINIFPNIAEESDQSINTIINHMGHKTVLFFIFFVILMVVITLSISVIRNKKKRIIILFLFITITFSLLFSLYNIIPQSVNSHDVYFIPMLINPLPGFENIAQSGNIVLGMAVCTIIITPLALKFAYNEYMKEITKKPLY